MRQPAALEVDKGESTTEELIALMTREVHSTEPSQHNILCDRVLAQPVEDALAVQIVVPLAVQIVVPPT